MATNQASQSDQEEGDALDELAAFEAEQDREEAEALKLQQELEGNMT